LENALAKQELLDKNTDFKENLEKNQEM